MLPPTPAATIAYGSPNACNGCHHDKDAVWADRQVRRWRARDYQAPVLKRAALVDAARKRDWTKLPEMLTYITDPDHDEVFAASLIRLVPPTQSREVHAALLLAARDPSALVRGAAVRALGLVPDPASLGALIAATGDEYRLVRVRAAAAMASAPAATTPPNRQEQVTKATEEYLASITARPDQWTSHYNMGNYRLDRGENREAIASYEAALKLDPRAVMAMVNASIAQARMGENDKAEKSLQMALTQAPGNAAANFNMGLLKTEEGDLSGAERYLRAAFKADPQMAQAAYNLAVIAARDSIGRAVRWCRRASDLQPQDPKYAYTLAFYLGQQGDRVEAVRILNTLVSRNPQDADALALLNELSK